MELSQSGYVRTKTLDVSAIIFVLEAMQRSNAVDDLGAFFTASAMYASPSSQ
jgi:hypothetical protein